LSWRNQLTYKRRTYAKTNQNIPISSCQNNGTPGEKGVAGITEIVGGESLPGFNQKRREGGGMKQLIVLISLCTAPFILSAQEYSWEYKVVCEGVLGGC